MSFPQTCHAENLAHFARHLQNLLLLTHCTKEIHSHDGSPQWGAADAEIKVPSGENTELKNVLPSKPGVGQYIAIHATKMPGISSFLFSTLPVHSPAFFCKTSPDFSCVGFG